ncbi:maltose operon periplasmic protein [Vibrio crassostreae]|uniref:MalM family protein n=1 Tax=Vibrio crassostreae TaxID=246167 RepID=UPI00104BA019|nr:MalM family protein [Vibrio crassostreae]TCN84704.1 maltose operon protein [Vibrio crassostreae]CAK2411546.1 maltose operon periplasmic protein [Vibrio crassostreae]CAK2441944.1 maltose operon periplasmic protein [Vibrio crassostreae]CAK2803106.1 maltose operon periplasmic protein [Vibrio crassostreae]CAK3303159.1 maltose operon periplasmic protein [Vibrio crassostreae]
MTNKSSMLAVVLGALLSGCASDAQVQTKLDAPTNAEVCCSDFSQFPYAQLNDNEDLKFDIDLGSPVGTFTTGNSHFAAFKFSERSGEMVVKLSSLMIDDSVFAPEAMLLDENFKPVQTLKFEDFKVQASDAFTRTSYIERLRIDASKTPYIVIYTPADELGNKVKVDHPAKVRAKEFGEVMPMVTDPVYTNQLGGRLELEIKTLKLRPYRAQAAVVPVAAVAAPAAVATNKAKVTPEIRVQQETQDFYLSAIKNAVESGDVPKALGLLDEAKALNVEGAQEAFVRAVNAK